MDIKLFINKLMTSLNKENINNVEAYYENIKTTFINIYENEVEKYIISEEKGVNLSGIYDGKFGSTYIEKFDDLSISEAIENIKQTSLLNNKIVFRKSDYKDIENRIKVKEIDIENIIKVLKEVQNKAFELDKRIKRVSSCSFTQKDVTVSIYNDKEIEMTDEYSFVVGDVSVIAQEGNVAQNGGSFDICKCFKDIDYEKLIEKSVNEACQMLSAKPIKSGKYNIILQNNVAANLFSGFMPVFSAENLQKNMSNFKGKLGQSVANKILNIIEDPSYEKGKSRRSFDDEGTILNKKYLIKDGLLENVLYDNKTATKDNVKSTGNSFRNSYKETSGIFTTNCYIQTGNMNTEEIIKNSDNTVIITEIDGLHAGIHPVTGDFSLSANGYFIDKGKIKKSINQITVAGNFYDLINNITDISSDESSSYQDSIFFISPSLKINELSIGGL